MAAPALTGGASISDILTALKNIATALNNASQTYLNVNGISNLSNISTAGGQYSQVKGAPGRICTVSVTMGGSSTGTIYDTVTTTSGVVSTNRPVYIIPENIGVYVVNIACDYGIVVAPGTGQALTVGYS
jgi:hypothetical protein